jgi:hypothetical protein
VIDDFIKMATSQLGINDQQARGATGSVLGMLKQNAPAGDFSKLLGSVPGAEGLLKQFGGGGGAPAGGGGGGLLGAAMGALGGGKSGGGSGGGGGGLLGAAMGALGGGGGGGGGLGALAGLMGALGNNGISADKAPQFLQMLMGFFQQKAGGDVVSGLLKNLPDLAKFVK